jgi:hypothetical protein
MYLASFGLFFIYNPIFGFLVPVLISLIFFPKKIMDLFTFRRYVEIFIVLIFVVTVSLAQYEITNPSNNPMFIKEAILIGYPIRLILCFIMIRFIGQRLRALNKSRFYILPLALPIISPFYLIFLYFWKEKPEEN